MPALSTGVGSDT
ncbi:hypothetical protein XELAEV_180328872mg, partial [Xenopus laevis]